jgi:hypothetical protein
MAYRLKPKRSGVDDFNFGAFSWIPLMEACGLLFPCMHDGGRWYCSFGADPRMPTGDDYPRIISNDGMKITEDEAMIMSRIARNLVAVQRSLPEENADQTPVGRTSVDRPTLEGMMRQVMAGKPLNTKWPVKLRADFVDRYETFAEWATRSGGFSIH